MKVEQVLKAAGYKITEGSAYGWPCYSPYARWLDLEEDVSCVFDANTREVFELHISNSDASKVWRWQEPRTIPDFIKECEKRGINPDDASESTKYIPIQGEAEAIAMVYEHMNAETEGDSLVQINMDDTELLKVCMMAHEKDMTLNEFVTHVLTIQLEHLKAQQVQDTTSPTEEKKSKKKNTKKNSS